MKFMKLGTRPDTFFTTESVRTVSSEVSTDLTIQVQNSLYLLHKFPLLSKCARLRRLCSESRNSDDGQSYVELPDIPGGCEAFEICAKFCYGIAVTVSALNVAVLRCASEHLGMTDDIDNGNLAGKLDSFFKSCVLNRRKDTLIVLQSTRRYSPLCEELGITPRCIEYVASTIPIGRWADEISDLGIDHFWRVMVTFKSSSALSLISDRIVGQALQVYSSRWLPNISSPPSPTTAISPNHRILLESIVGLLPTEKGAVPCSFLFKLLKSANILNASTSTKTNLTRRVGVQLEEATVEDLLVQSQSRSCVNETMYDVELVMGLLEEFKLQRQSPPISPARVKNGFERRRRSRSVEREDGGRRSSASAASHSSKLRVARLVDAYLQEIARDPNLSTEKVIELAEAVPDFARPDHDDLYRVIDIYLRAHPSTDKSQRKQLCRILDCKKLSVEACIHAARNELLPLRVVVQVLFFEHARALAKSGGRADELPSSIKALLANATESGKNVDEDDWSVSGANCPPTKLATLKMKLAEDDDEFDDDIAAAVAEREGGLLRSSSSRFRSLCTIPNKPRRILSKLWSMNRSVRERQ